MNKDKNKEIKGFLKWIEREIGVEVDSLANKTALKEYHEKLTLIDSSKSSRGIEAKYP